MFDLEKENTNITNLCDYIDRMKSLKYDLYESNSKQEADLQEPIDQDYPYGEWDLIEQHNHNFAECLEYDQMQTLKEAFPEGY